ncbi:MAG: RluA family pseudouridine synthase [Actinobacteria bacterium]|nr:MAG: RluA family pseudouridine synthase [Actinomycetota bacterium]
MAEPSKFSYIVQAEEEEKRLDLVLAKRPEIASRSFAQRLIKNKHVEIDGTIINKSYKVKYGQTLTYSIPVPEVADVEPENIKIEIVYEDDDLAVINKPAGLVVHPSYGHWEGTLVNALLYHLDGLSTIGGIKRPGIVHRLDKLTSGLMLVAKNDFSHIELSKAIKERKVSRMYLALVYDRFKEDKFTIEAPIGRHQNERKKMTVRADSRYAKTNAKVIKQYKDYTLLELSLVTGRTHQIRVHLSYINHPIVGDDIYGRKKSKKSLGLNRPFLHAYKISFNHPKTGKRLEFEKGLPDELIEALESIN